MKVAPVKPFFAGTERDVFEHWLKFGRVPAGMPASARSRVVRALIDGGYAKKSPGGALVAAGMQRFKPRNYARDLGFYRMVARLQDLVQSSGFERIAWAPLASTFECFGRLLQDSNHPSRAATDTLYARAFANHSAHQLNLCPLAEKDLDCSRVASGFAFPLVLIPHTTALLFSAIKKSESKCGLRYAIGRVFRNQRQDRTHSMEFHQLEINVIARRANLAMLRDIFLQILRIFGYSRENIRFNQCFYGYTQPSLEVQVRYGGEWVEIGGGGVFRRQVLHQVGVPGEFAAIGMGIGLERLYMISSGIRDLRTAYRTPAY